MPSTVSASQAQKNFGEWHERAMREPVRITKHGRESAYLISAETFHELWASFRKPVRVEDLTEAEVAMIMRSRIPAEHAYELTDRGAVSGRRKGRAPRSGRE
jgi:prevent-host-death family protein